MISRLEKPPLLYKYHKINHNLYELLKNQTLWFSDLTGLNDPFDCRYSFSKKFFQSHYKKAVREMYLDLKKVMSDLQFNQDDLYKFIGTQFTNKEFEKNFLDTHFSKVGVDWSVCCFTTQPLNELMWAHYANSFDGVCLEFDLSKDDSFFEKVFPVVYKNKFPVLNAVNDIPKALLTKRLVWKYENEWRIISNGKGARVFNMDSLSAIIFGYKVEKGTRDAIENLLRSSGYKVVKFKKAGVEMNGIKY